jgi:2-amino-4-hydroxy-6-hydroxymethyldihydropteridine diphosphokinase
MPSDAPDAGAKGIRIGLGLGSNIGDKAGNIRTALARLEGDGVCAIEAVSSLYRTAPWGFAEQDDFVNACALAWTKLAPAALLAEIKRIECEMGRQAAIRWGPRLIDIDILFYGDAPVEKPDLVLPHKELFNRAFVLVPLAEIAPNLRVGGRAIAEAAAGMDRSGIEKWHAERT